MKDFIKIKNAHLHNLKNIDIDVPLNQITAIAGVSGSGKSSLAMGIIYAEGSRRYLSSLPAFNRYHCDLSGTASADEILYVPASIALSQRPASGGIRSTFGTSSELLNTLRLMFSRLAQHKCPSCGTYHTPSLNAATQKHLVCKKCSFKFYSPSAQDFAFNGKGACPCCHGTGMLYTVNMDSLIADENLSIDEGAVAPWKSLMWSLMTDVCREMGVRTHIPFKDLSDKEKDIVFNGPMVKKQILYIPKNKDQATKLDFTYYSAVNTVKNALSKVKDETGLKRLERFLKYDICKECNGSRFNTQARDSLLNNQSIDILCSMPLNALYSFINALPSTLPDTMQIIASDLIKAFNDNADDLISMGLDYLSLNRAYDTLSTGERQRIALCRIARSRTTGVLYVLDEPSIGLHPYNIEALHKLMERIIDDGNSIVLVDHDADILKKADYLIELGPESGDNGGFIIAKGSIDEIKSSNTSKIAQYLKIDGYKRLRELCPDSKLFSKGSIKLESGPVHTLKDLSLLIPKGRLCVVTGVSGSGKTTLILESLVPAVINYLKGKKLPAHVKSLDLGSIKHVKLIDAEPIGTNCRSTVATYTGIHDSLRKLFAKEQKAKDLGFKAGDFSYNTGALRCDECDGLGVINLDVQFLPDIEITCPYCHGSRYIKKADDIIITSHDIKESLPSVLKMHVEQALSKLSPLKGIASKLKVLDSLGLGYLSLGESTAVLSGGEAQRLKLASELDTNQSETLFIFDEPTIGLHPADVQKLLSVFDILLKKGASIIVIEHDLNLIANADYIIDMGPYSGDKGGCIVFQGSVEKLRKSSVSITGRYL